VQHQGFKFRIYPTPEQESILRQTIGACRYVYNWALEQKRESWVTNKKSLSYCATSRELTLKKTSPETPWLNDVSSVALQQTLRNLDTAYVNFFKKRGRFPKFKSKKNGGSATYLSNSFRLKDEAFYLAKIKTPVKVVWSRKLPSEPSSCNVSQNATGQWFVSFLCETEDKILPRVDKRIGIDVGIESFATTSDGEKFSQPKSIRQARKKLAKLQRRHSKKKLGSKNREKARRKVARCYQRVTDTRKDFLHKLSTRLVRENQTIAVEDLSVASMMKNRHLSRVISEQGWREFRTMLEYKCRWYGRELVTVDRFYPSSKTCSCCGRKTNLSLSQRQWVCACGASHDRDVNAAKNILAAGQVVSPVERTEDQPRVVSRGSSRRSRKTQA
jgi:putative transposase